MPKTYEAKVTQTREVIFTFTEDEIEDADTPEEAAGELAEVQPDISWDLVDEEIKVSEIDPEDA